MENNNYMWGEGASHLPYMLLEHLNCTNIVMAEIGVYAGESTVKIMQTGRVNTLYAIDPWENGYDSDDIASYKVPMDRIEKEFDFNTRSYQNVVKIKKTSAEASYMFKDGFFDLIFLDACHKYESVKLDISMWLPKIKLGGWFTGDDFHNDHPEVIRAVIDSFGMPEIYGFLWYKKKE